MEVISLSSGDLALASILVLLLALVTGVMQLGLGRRLILSGIRTTVQLLLIGFVLRFLFTGATLPLIAGLGCIMLTVAGREVWVRQKRRLRGFRGYAIGTSSMFISSFSVTLFALLLLIDAQPWYTPQYAIPLLGMLLGNTMNGVALASDQLTSQLYEKRHILEQRLLLGETWQQASGEIRRSCMRTGMMPIINAMAAAGIVSLPGMMTGQILGGSPPMEAVKYQILIMFLIAAGTGFGVISAIWLISHQLFDSRHRLRLEGLKPYSET